jgi:regulation of enolase protein 1 (concanavalin A-like superfamily)
MIDNYFYEDGSLRDIYILHTNLSDWELIFEYLDKQNIQYRITKDGETIDERTTSELMKMRDEYSIAINYKGISISGYFNEAEYIEFDVTPKQIQTEEAVNVVIEFMVEISTQTNKKVILTEEMNMDNVFIRVNPTGIVTYL